MKAKVLIDNNNQAIDNNKAMDGIETKVHTPEMRLAFASGRMEMKGLQTSPRPERPQWEIKPDTALTLNTLMGLLRPGLLATTPPVSFGPDKGEVHWVSTGEQIATLDDVHVNVIRQGQSTGTPFLSMSLDYMVTSHGAHTERPHTVGGVGSALSTVYFLDQNGGVLYVWDLWKWNFFFDLECGWTKKFQLFQGDEYKHIDWFELCTGYRFSVEGGFFRC